MILYLIFLFYCLIQIKIDITARYRSSYTLVKFLSGALVIGHPRQQGRCRALKKGYPARTDHITPG